MLSIKYNIIETFSFYLIFLLLHFCRRGNKRASSQNLWVDSCVSLCKQAETRCISPFVMGWGPPIYRQLMVWGVGSFML